MVVCMCRPWLCVCGLFVAYGVAIFVYVCGVLSEVECFFSCVVVVRLSVHVHFSLGLSPRDS